MTNFVVIPLFWARSMGEQWKKTVKERERERAESDRERN
jgi:hypothetical protein